MKKRNSFNAGAWVATIWFALVLAGVVLTTPASGLFRISGPTGDPPRECMSRALWSAIGGQRPCIRISRLYEDGSARIVQESYDNRTRVICKLHNPSEEQGRFTITCRRVR